MITAPFRALSIYGKHPKLWALGFIPGALTFLLASLTVYFAWQFFLATVTLWISLPVMILGFTLAWLVFGNLSVLPIEDFLIDETMKAEIGEVRWKSRGFHVQRFIKEFIFSAVILTCGFILFMLAFVPLFTLPAFVGTCWLTAYGFLGPNYARVEDRLGGRIRMFFCHPVENFFLGLVLSFILFVPVLNVFLLGYSQVLATIVFIRQSTRLLEPENKS